MSRLPRKLLFDPAEVGVYHLINRCVRRAFLCGFDAESGRSYDHRKLWLQNRMELLAGTMACEILGFAILSNHFHLVVRNRPDLVAGWSDEEVARRWYRLCPLRRDADGNPAQPTEADLGMIVHVPNRLAEIRSRLSNPSWMMRFLTEKVARMANAEDKATGRFWQGRFSMQRLLDEAAVTACLVYVDLNPIRAGIAQTPEESRFTSAYERIQAAVELCVRPNVEPTAGVASPTDASMAGLVAAITPTDLVTQDVEASANASALPVPLTEAPNPPQCSTPGPSKPTHDEWLAPLEISADYEKQPVPGARASNRGCVEMSFASYLELLEWSGRQWRTDKRCAIPDNLPAIFERLAIPGERWMELLRGFHGRFRRVAGSPAAMAAEAERRGRRYLHGMPASRCAYEQSPTDPAGKS